MRGQNLEKLVQRIEELTFELSFLKEKINKFASEAERWDNERKEIYKQIRVLREEANKFKQKRDLVNRTVQQLKNLREQTKKECDKKNTMRLLLNKNMSSLIEKNVFENRFVLQKEIEELEWKIQTNPLTLEEEKKIVEQVKILASQLFLHNKIQELKARLFSLQTDMNANKLAAKLSHKNLLSLVRKSKKNHERMLEILSQVQRCRDEVGVITQRYERARQQVQNLYQKRRKLLRQIRALKQKQKLINEEKRRARQFELSKKLEAEAFMKWKRGQKLTWEEFKILFDKKSISQTISSET
jgi:uncharacterized coiled-coil DUF342 family protein